jgi:hypothetical protein
MRTVSIFGFLYFIFISLTLRSQPDFPPNYPVFDSSVVARIDITIDPDTLEWIYDNVESDIRFHARFVFSNGTIRDTLEDIGFSLGGNTSRYSQKKSFNIDFNHFISGREFYDLDKLNLNGEHNDPSVIRSRICWEWLRAFRVPAPRAAHAMVYINGNAYGLYMMVEQIDDEFVDSRFGNDDGNLYKCLWPADLDYLGPNPDQYKLFAGDRRVYDLRTNETLDDYSDLAHFIDVLNNTPIASLECELEKVFNVHDYLRIIALDVITGNWDGYIYNKNNFYLYKNTETGKFEYIPYDLDNTLGIDWLDRDWGTRNIYDWEQHGAEVRPLYTRLLESPGLRDWYSYYVKSLLDLLADEDSLFAHIDGIRNMIAPYILQDPYYPLDYGYTFSDFQSSFDQALGGHVDYGLKPFIQVRKTNAYIQLQLADIYPVVKYIDQSRPQPGKEYWVRAFAEDNGGLPAVRLKYRINQGTVEYLEMTDDGEHHDKEPGDGIYGAVLPAFQLGESLSWQVEATDAGNRSTLKPCEAVSVVFNPSADPQLFINELMADNDTTIADEYGEYDNWAEIYNADVEPVWLGDKYLSDNPDNPDKWQFPDITLQPGEFLLVWTDGQPEQGPLHAGYKLNDEGETLAIFDNETTGYFLIDSVNFGMQSIDVSYGREADGIFPWVFFTTPTPGFSNTSGFYIGEKTARESLFVFPNPVSGGSLHFREPFSGTVYDLTGRIVGRGDAVSFINTESWPDGIYLLRDETGRVAKVCVRRAL